jgi:rare lipoprotein A
MSSACASSRLRGRPKVTAGAAEVPRRLGVTAALAASLSLAGCSLFHRETPEPAPGPVQVGTASWYGADFHGRRTASGERFDQRAFTAASRSFPIGSHVHVTNLANGRSVVVRVNDRGPFARGRVIDVSHAAAVALGMVARGTARVRVEAIDDGSSRSVTGQARTARPRNRRASPR